MKIRGYFLFALLILSYSGRALDLNMREVDLPPGVEPTAVSLLYTDNHGFLWLAAEAGLYRFDGNQYQSYSTDTSGRPGDVITALYHDRKGEYWLGWQSGQVQKLQQDHTVDYESAEGQPQQEIAQWTEDAAGRLWMATAGEGVYVRDSMGRWHNFNHGDGLPSDYVYGIIPWREGVLVATERGLARAGMSGRAKWLKPVETALSDQIAKALRPFEAGVAVGFYEAAMDVLNSGEGRVQSMVAPAEDAKDIFRAGGAWWWLSEGGDFFRSNPSGTWLPVFDESLGRNEVRQITRDQEGHIWAATHRGLYQIDAWYSALPTESPVRAVCEDEGQIWYGQGNAVYYLEYWGASPELLWEGEHLIISLYRDAFGRLWAGSFDGGLWCYAPGKGRQHFTEADGLSNNNVLAIHGNSSGLWLGTLGGVSYLPFDDAGSPGTIRSFRENALIRQQYVYDVSVVAAEQVYFGTDGHGVVIWTGEEFVYLRQQEAPEIVLDLAAGESGDLFWVNPEGALWQRKDGGEIARFAPPEKLRGVVSGLVVLADQSVVLVDEGGLHRWMPEQQDWISYGRAYGLRDLRPELHAQAISSRGSFYLGGGRGLIRLQMEDWPQRPEPHTALEGVELFFEPTKERDFKASENHLTFRYTGRWYTDPARVRYRIRLEGYDLDWIETQNKEVTYPRLAPGSYVFSVVAGVEGHFPEDQIRQVAFHIAAPWYVRWYSILAGVLLLGGLAATLFRLRFNALRKKQEREKLRVRAQYEVLKSQVNPHFLFNSFNTLMALIEDDPQQATAYLSDLSDFFRHILEYRHQDLIALRQELRIVHTYLELQARRFGENLQVEIEVPESVQESLIPPLTLQLLLENAFKHNIISRQKPLELRIFHENGHLVVWNRRQPKDHAEPSTGYGLNSIEQKYAYYTGRPVRVLSEEAYFSVYLPLIQKANYDSADH